MRPFHHAENETKRRIYGSMRRDGLGRYTMQGSHRPQLFARRWISMKSRLPLEPKVRVKGSARWPRRQWRLPRRTPQGPNDRVAKFVDGAASGYVTRRLRSAAYSSDNSHIASIEGAQPCCCHQGICSPDDFRNCSTRNDLLQFAAETDVVVALGANADAALGRRSVVFSVHTASISLRDVWLPA